MKPHQRVLWLALLATLAAVAYVPEQEPAIVGVAPSEERGTTAPTINVHATATAAAVDGPSLVADLQDRMLDEAPETSFFENRSWQRPPAPIQPVVQQAPPPPAATVPAIPFRYVGRYQDGGAHAVFLEFQQQSLVARIGEVLGDAWKVEAIEDNRMVLLYIPMNEKRTLEWSATP